MAVNVVVVITVLTLTVIAAVIVVVVGDAIQCKDLLNLTHVYAYAYLSDCSLDKHRLSSDKLR